MLEKDIWGHKRSLHLPLISCIILYIFFPNFRIECHLDGHLLRTKESTV